MLLSHPWVREMEERGGLPFRFLAAGESLVGRRDHVQRVAPAADRHLPQGEGSEAANEAHTRKGGVRDGKKLQELQVFGIYKKERVR